MSRLRWRLAQWLVGPFVNLPMRDGVWIVSRMGRAVTTMEANEFSLTMATDLDLKRYSNDPDGPFDSRFYPPANRTSVFQGTLKS